MDTKALKNKILQLAIQGKLVPQEPKDEPASALLEKIKEEKEKLIKEKKIKKQKPLPSITEEEIPFEIPAGWEWVRLGEVVEVKSSKRIFKKDYVENGIPFFRSKEIGELDSGNYTESAYHISREKYNDIKINYGVPIVGDLLLTSVGTIGNVWIVDNREFYFKDGNITQIVNSKYINMEYIKYFIKSLLFFKQVSNSTSGTAYNALTIIKIKKMVLPLPPLAEQKRIVEKVDALFSLIDALDSNKDQLQETINITRNKVLEEAVQGKLVPQNPEDEPASVLLEKIKEEKERLIKEKKIKKQKPLPPITEEELPSNLPKGWEWARLGECCIINPRNSFDDNQKASFIPMTLIEEGFKNKHKSETKLWKEIKKGFTHFAENDVAVAKITPCFGNRKSAIMRNLYNKIGAGTTELHIIRSINGLILPEYLLSIFKTDKFIQGGVDTYTGTAGQQRIKKDYLMNLVIGVPPLAEQKRIVKKANKIMALCDELEKKINITL